VTSVRTVDVDRRRAVIQCALAGVGVLAVAAMLLAPGPVSAPLTVIAVLLVPGAAITGFVAFAELATEAILAFFASVAVAVFGGQLMLWLHLWHPEPLFVTISLISAGLLMRHASRPPATPPAGDTDG